MKGIFWLWKSRDLLQPFVEMVDDVQRVGSFLITQTKRIVVFLLMFSWQIKFLLLLSDQSSLLRNYSQGVKGQGTVLKCGPTLKNMFKGEQIYDLLEFLAKFSYTFYSNTKQVKSCFHRWNDESFFPSKSAHDQRALSVQISRGSSSLNKNKIFKRLKKLQDFFLFLQVSCNQQKRS